jgi:integrase
VTNADDPALSALGALLKANDLDASDLLNAIAVLADAKRTLSTKSSPEEDGAYKVFQDKELIYPNLTDAFIYRNGKTKNRNYYIRIFDEESKRLFVRSLKTTSREKAIIDAQVIYRESRSKLSRGERLSSIATAELIELYLKKEQKRVSNLPKAGITEETFKTKQLYLRYWHEFIQHLKLSRTPIEKIPVEATREFGYWLQNKPKERYNDRPRSREYINSAISEVKKMYRDLAIRDRYITQSGMPQIDLLKVQPDSRAKRDAFTREELRKFKAYIEYDYTNQHDDSEWMKRVIFQLFMDMLFLTGMRPNELLSLKWGDISENQNDTKEQRKEHRLVTVRKENSKTGSSRVINARIGKVADHLKWFYEQPLGLETRPSNFLFQNIAKTKRGSNAPYELPGMTKRFQYVLDHSGLTEQLKKEERHLTLYSTRHTYTTFRLQDANVDIHLLAKNLGTSVFYIEKTYSHIETAQNTGALNKNIEDKFLYEELTGVSKFTYFKNNFKDYKDHGGGIKSAEWQEARGKAKTE